MSPIGRIPLESHERDPGALLDMLGIMGGSPEIQGAVDALVAATAAGETISIDRIGDALGAMSVGTPEIEWVFAALEAAGRKIGSDEGGRGEANLRVVLIAARTLRQRNGKVPTGREIAEETGLPETDVAYALALAKVMQR